MNKPVGRIAKKFGMSGQLIVNLYDTFPEEFDTQEPLMVVIDSLAVPLFCEEFERRGVSGAVVRFADFDTPERTEELLGIEFFVRSSQTDDDAETDDEFYMDDFVGFEARFKGSKKRGTVTDFIDNEMNPLFIVAVEATEIMVPAVDEMISSYSVKRREVVFDLPDGLFELNG